MPDNDSLDTLIVQLLDSSNPRRQKQLIQQIAKLDDPRSITPLASLYTKTDVDPSVKQAAAEVLRRFRVAEAKFKGVTPPDVKPAARRLSLPLGTLTRLRTILALLLVVTLAGNGLLSVARALNREDPDAPIAGAAAPSLREDLTKNIQERLAATRADASYLRKRWEEVQSRVPLTCAERPFSGQATARPFAADAKNYPDWEALNAQANQAARLLIPQVDAGREICKTPRDLANLDRIAGEGGAVQRIIQTDGVLKAVEQAEVLLEKWQNSPLPTFSFSPTPTIPTAIFTPSLTQPPTITRTPTIGPSPTQVPPTNPPPPTSAASPTTVAPTAVPATIAASPTILQAVTLPDVGFTKFKAVNYRVTLVYQTANGSPILSGTLILLVRRGPEALTPNSSANVAITVQETGGALISKVNPAFYLPGRIEYTLKGGQYYRDVVTPPSQAGCRVTAASAAQAASLDSVTTGLLALPDGLTLARTTRTADLVNFRYPVFEGTAANGAKVEVAYDARVGAPVRLVQTFTNVTSAVGLSAPANTKLNISVTYELLDSNADLTTIRTPTCTR